MKNEKKECKKHEKNEKSESGKMEDKKDLSGGKRIGKLKTQDKLVTPAQKLKGAMLKLGRK